MGWPFGRGRRGPVYGAGGGPVTYPEDELSQLGAQANWLQEQLDLIQQRMDELKGRATSETQSNTEA